MTAASGGSSSHVPAARDAPDDPTGSPGSAPSGSPGTTVPPGALPPGKTASPERTVAGDLGAATGVLADRIAAALVHREPGWRLPRRSALARRYNVGVPEIDAAISELIRRSLIRRLPDG